MEIHLFVWIILQLGAIYMTEANCVQSIYKKTQQGQNITGKRGAELTVVSQLECSIKCGGAKKCVAYQYQGTGPWNCLLIHPNCSDIEEPIFEQEKGDQIFKEVSLGWTKPNYWLGAEAVLYYSFDTSERLVLMEGSQQVCHFPLLSGKLNSALTLNHTKSQWVDLGIHTEACMTRPETCAAAGGAVSLWVNVIDFSTHGGIVSSLVSDKTGTLIRYSPSRIMSLLYVPDGLFAVHHTKTSGWTHVVLNFIGPDEGQGISLFFNGVKVANDTSKTPRSKSAGDGRIVVGRNLIDEDRLYPNAQVDELIYYNRALRKTDIELLYNAV